MTTGLPDAYPPRVAIAAGSAVLGKVSLVDSGGADATDVTAHASKTREVNAAGTGASNYDLNTLGDGSAKSAFPVMRGVAAFPLIFNGATVDQQYAAITSKVLRTQALGPTAVWTPASGKKFRLMGVLVTFTGDVSTAGGGNIVVKLLDGAVDMLLDTVSFTPAAAGAVAGQDYHQYIGLGNGRPSSTANNVLNATLSAALASGAVQVLAIGCEQ